MRRCIYTVHVNKIHNEIHQNAVKGNIEQKIFNKFKEELKNVNYVVGATNWDETQNDVTIVKVYVAGLLDINDVQIGEVLHFRKLCEGNHKFRCISINNKMFVKVVIEDFWIRIH